MTTRTLFHIDRDSLFTYEKFNGFSHLLMVPVSFVLTIISVVTAAHLDSIFKVTAVSVYGFTMMTVFLCSGLYHLVPSGPRLKKILRRIDQASIFPYIAATSMLVTLIPLWEANGVLLTILIWAASLAGMYLKVREKDLPFWLEVTAYVILGCLCLVDADVLLTSLPPAAFWMLVGGGASYIIGAVIVALEERLDPDGNKNFHEFWHILVIIGTLLHWIVIQWYIIYL